MRHLKNPLFWFFLVFILTIAIGSYEVSLSPDIYAREIGIGIFMLGIGIVIYAIRFSRRHEWWES